MALVMAVHGGFASVSAQDEPLDGLELVQNDMLRTLPTNEVQTLRLQRIVAELRAGAVKHWLALLGNNRVEDVHRAVFRAAFVLCTVQAFVQDCAQSDPATAVATAVEIRKRAAPLIEKQIPVLRKILEENQAPALRELVFQTLCGMLIQRPANGLPVFFDLLAKEYEPDWTKVEGMLMAAIALAEVDKTLYFSGVVAGALPAVEGDVEQEVMIEWQHWPRREMFARTCIMINPKQNSFAVSNLCFGRYRLSARSGDAWKSYEVVIDSSQPVRTVTEDLWSTGFDKCSGDNAVRSRIIRPADRKP